MRLAQKLLAQLRDSNEPSFLQYNSSVFVLQARFVPVVGLVIVGQIDRLNVLLATR